MFNNNRPVSGKAVLWQANLFLTITKSAAIQLNTTQTYKPTYFEEIMRFNPFTSFYIKFVLTVLTPLRQIKLRGEMFWVK